MKNSTRERKRKQYLEREALILETAQRMIQQYGFTNLKMSQLAAEIEYSTGTLYQHFPSKEDMLLAMTSVIGEERNYLFDRIRDWETLSRDRLTALIVAEAMFVCLHPNYFENEHLVYSDPVWSKASPDSKERMQKANESCLAVIRHIVHDAVEYGDVELAQSELDDTVFALWSMVVGTHTFVHSSHSMQLLEVPKPYVVLFKTLNAYLDGLKWKNGTAPSNYAAFFNRVAQEVFNMDLKDRDVQNFCRHHF